jgi:hypothetical protein
MVTYVARKSRNVKFQELYNRAFKRLRFQLGWTANGGYRTGATRQRVRSLARKQARMELYALQGGR